ncbi:MAG: TVP38/TMEM64 family protein [Clostridia bacterium]|nr:TVP38/TMEM64 family protein [Clostridia bacterium]
MNKKIIIFLVASIILVTLLVTLDLGNVFTVDNLLENKDELIDITKEHWLISAVIYFISYILLVSIGLPVFIVYALAAGLMFGFVIGSILTVVASFIGAVITFLVTRHLMYDYFRNKYGHRLEKMENRFKNKELKVILGLRLFPGMPYSVITVFAALSPMKIENFMIGTFIGNVPKKLLLVYMGAVTRTLGELYEIKTPKLILPLIGFGLIVLISFIKHHFKAKHI